MIHLRYDEEKITHFEKKQCNNNNNNDTEKKQSGFD